MAWVDGKFAEIYIWETKDSDPIRHYAKYWDIACGGTLLQLQDDDEDGDGYIHSYILAKLYKFKFLNNYWG